MLYLQAAYGPLTLPASVGEGITYLKLPAQSMGLRPRAFQYESALLHLPVVGQDSPYVSQQAFMPCTICFAWVCVFICCSSAFMYLG